MDIEVAIKTKEKIAAAKKFCMQTKRKIKEKRIFSLSLKTDAEPNLDTRL